MIDPIVDHHLYIGFPPEDETDDDEPLREMVVIRTKISFNDGCTVSVTFRAPLDIGPEELQTSHARALQMVDPKDFPDSRPLDMLDLLGYLRTYRKEHRQKVLSGELRGALLVLKNNDEG